MRGDFTTTAQGFAAGGRTGFFVGDGDNFSMQHGACVECGEAMLQLSAVGAWHEHCATLALSSLRGGGPRGCPRCGELARRNILDADNSIADYNDRRWHVGCAADALGALVVARRRVLLASAGGSPERVDSFAAEVWGRLIETACPGTYGHGPMAWPPRLRHECNTCVDEDRAWLSARALQLVAEHLGGALRLLVGALRRPPPSRDDQQ